MEEYITDEQFESLLEELLNRLQDGNLEKVHDFLEQLIYDAEHSEKYIDRTYVSEVKEKKRVSKISDINRMLNAMSLKQIENVHTYVSDELDEPNHEAVALDAIKKLSRERSEEGNI